MKLWVDGKTEEDIEYFINIDSTNVIYNLLEDIQCLKENINNLSKLEVEDGN